MKVNVKVLGAGDMSRWDAFVRAEPACSLYHLAAWKTVLERAFPVRTLYLYAERDRAITGVLPVAQQKSLLFGNRFTSLPFCTYGGVRAVDQESRRALLEQAARLAAQAGGKYLELRESAEMAGPENTGPGLWRAGGKKVTVLLPLDGSPQSLLQGMDSMRRRNISKARKNGLRFELGGPERVEEFYKVFSTNMRDLGTPVYPKAFFQAVLEHGEHFRLGLVMHQGRVVAAGLLARWRETLEIPLLSALRSDHALSPTAMLYWGAVEHAYETGCRVLDLGRCTPGSGTHNYKLKFGGREQALPWLYWLPPGGVLPSLDREQPRFQRLIRAWQRLPVWLTNRIGPPIASRLY